MNKMLLFVQLTALVAVTCAQQQQLGAAVESPELLRRRQEFQAAARTAQLSQQALQEEFQRSVALANREPPQLLQQQQLQQQQQQHDLKQQQQQQQQQQKQQLLQQQKAHRLGGSTPSRQHFQASPIQQAPQRILIQAPAAPPIPQRQQLRQNSDQGLTDKEEELFRKQALSAKYTFNSAINDGIMDNTHTREETRDGLKVTGSYSYSDGYFKRIVFYEADEDGYRVVKEKAEPIGNGPLVDLEGSADVRSSISGVDNQYTITTSDIGRFRARDEPTANLRKNF